jgi:hypothetical protein
MVEGDSSTTDLSSSIRRDCGSIQLRKGARVLIEIRIEIKIEENGRMTFQGEWDLTNLRSCFDCYSKQVMF